MYKTSVYTLVNGNIQGLAHQKHWYCPHHTDSVSICW